MNRRFKLWLGTTRGDSSDPSGHSLGPNFETELGRTTAWEIRKAVGIPQTGRLEVGDDQASGGVLDSAALGWWPGGGAPCDQRLLVKPRRER